MTIDTTIVVPCFNEEKRLLPAEFLRFLAASPTCRLLFVNDGSRDDTRGVLAALKAHNERQIAVLELPQNGGKAEAVRQGVLAALALAAADGAADPFIGYFDADLATPLAELGRILAIARELPVPYMFAGARVRLLGADVRRTWYRHYLGRLFTTGASTALRLGVYDTQCGAKLFRANAVLAAVFREPFRTRWIFDVEVFARYMYELRRQGAGRPEIESRFAEIALKAWRDVKGSKVKPSDFARAAWDLWQIRRRYDLA